MAKKKIITISGRPGSGKSTASRSIAEALGYEHFSSGDLFRAIGRELGSDVHQANLNAEQEGNIDFLVDQRLREIGATQENVAIDSRMAWHWIPESYKVYLDLDLEVAAHRILANIDQKRLEHEHIPEDPIEYAHRLQQRLESEARRYRKLYDVDPYDTSNYDIVVDTANKHAQEVLVEILAGYESWSAS